jgi:hypothetical protein
MSKMKSKDRAGAPVAAGAATTARAKPGRKTRLLAFAVAAILVWGSGAYAYIYFMPHMYYNAARRAMIRHGIGTTRSPCSNGRVSVPRR